MRFSTGDLDKARGVEIETRAGLVHQLSLLIPRMHNPFPKHRLSAGFCWRWGSDYIEVNATGFLHRHTLITAVFKDNNRRLTFWVRKDIGIDAGEIRRLGDTTGAEYVSAWFSDHL
jgi:hypothetical protein